MYIDFAKPIHHWNYFLAIEHDMLKTARYVEICKDNLKTYSVEYTKIILAAASEVDVLLKQIYLALGGDKERPNFGDYYHAIKEKLPAFFLEPLHFEQYNIGFDPFTEWENGLKLSWHEAFNNLKHNRTENYKDANLENALLSLSALYTTVVHYYLCSAPLKASIKERPLLDVIQSLSPHSKMMQFSNHPQSFCM